MEPEASRAAISAIAALQNRIKQLEYEHDSLILKKEDYQKKILDKDKAIEKRLELANIASEKAKSMMICMGKAMNDLSKARIENKKLREQIKSTESLIPSVGSGDAYNRKAKRKIKKEYDVLMSKVNDYELLLSEYLKPKLINPTPDGALALAVADNDPSLLPEPYASTLAELIALPKKFRPQEMDVKRKIIRALCKAKLDTAKLSVQLRNLQRKPFSKKSKPERFDSKYNRVAAQHYMIAKEMSLFSFD